MNIGVQQEEKTRHTKMQEEDSNTTIKKFDNNEEFCGIFVDGIEHGEGTWSFETSLGHHKVSGLWETGRYTNVSLDPDEVYEGECRYGVPHRDGMLTIGDFVLEGERRAGKMHGLGTAQSPEGQYDGTFFEGEYHGRGGKFKNSLKHGYGREEGGTGVYEGMFRCGQRHGYGTWDDGEPFFQGTWDDGAFVEGSKFVTSDKEAFDLLDEGGDGTIDIEDVAPCASWVKTPPKPSWRTCKDRAPPGQP